VLEGTLFTACSATNLVAINTAPPPPNPNASNQPGDYHIIPVSQIKSFEVLSLSADGSQRDAAIFETAVPAISKVDIGALKAREEAAIRKLKEQDMTRGKGVTREAQEIFDALHRIFPTRWHGQAIIVNDAVIIKSPYRLEDCQAEKDKQTSLVQVRKHLEAYMKKKGQQGVKPAVATPIPPRKGG
ncbi:hypothetical protein P152DRAFT_388996, partial [Eremomyces bilateralis CBS 781.70]